MDEFPLGVADKIGYYVYLLSDPRTKKVFYVGKGKGNRIFSHVKASLDSSVTNDKLDFIRTLIAENLKVEYRILRHGLTEEMAFEVEAALIDYIGLEALSNQVYGAGTDDRGIMSVAEIIAKYAALEADIQEPAILVTVNRLYRRDMNSAEIYEITRGNWVIGANRNRAKYAFAVYHGIIQAVFKIDRWEAIETSENHQKQHKRWRFEGTPATELQDYIGRSTINYITVGAQNPIRYVNLPKSSDAEPPN